MFRWIQLDPMDRWEKECILPTHYTILMIPVQMQAIQGNKHNYVRDYSAFYKRCFSQAPPAAHIPPGTSYAPGMSVLAESHAGKRIQAQGHPLKSFTVPAPPPISAPGTPQLKHIGKYYETSEILLLKFDKP